MIKQVKWHNWVTITWLNVKSIQTSCSTTIKHFDIKSDSKGNIVFPYYDETGNHVLNKFRISRKFRQS